MLADDILIFIRVVPRNAAKLAKLLSIYKDSSGQYLNLKKSLIFMGKCNSRLSARIKDIFKSRSSSFPSLYLSAPLLLGWSRHRHFDSLIATVRKKLASWRAHSLSFSGQLVLIKHVLASMPLHIAMVLPCSVSICKSIESCMRQFLWSASETKTKVNYQLG